MDEELEITVTRLAAAADRTAAATSDGPVGDSGDNRDP